MDREREQLRKEEVIGREKIYDKKKLYPYNGMRWVTKQRGTVAVPALLYTGKSKPSRKYQQT